MTILVSHQAVLPTLHNKIAPMVQSNMFPRNSCDCQRSCGIFAHGRTNFRLFCNFVVSVSLLFCCTTWCPHVCKVSFPSRWYLLQLKAAVLKTSFWMKDLFIWNCFFLRAAFDDMPKHEQQRVKKWHWGWNVVELNSCLFTIEPKWFCCDMNNLNHAKSDVFCFCQSGFSENLKLTWQGQVNLL